jgi:serine/threonine-protein kinase HipA
MTRVARVFLDGALVGRLEELADRSTAFTYDQAWLRRTDAVPVSVTMPLRSEPFEHRHLLPFFANLLPEGWLLELSVTKLRVSRDDLFGLLLATCRDCVGAVEIRPLEES